MRNQDSDESENRRKKHLVLLFFLFLITVVTSAITGYLLGRTAQVPAGRMVDTIELGPETGETEETEIDEEALLGRRIHLAGQILYTDGTPCANSLVRLHSEPRETYTDSSGRFFFEAVEPGEHTVSVLKDGVVTAESHVEITQEPGKQNLGMKKTEKVYKMVVNTTVRLIQVDLELDEGGQTLSFRENTTAAVTDDGAVVTSDGMRRSDGPMVLSSGIVITSDHSIILTDQVITPENQVAKIPAEGLTTSDGITATPDGAKLLPDGVKVTTEGKLEGDDSGKYLVSGQPDRNQAMDDQTKDETGMREESQTQPQNQAGDGSQKLADGQTGIPEETTDGAGTDGTESGGETKPEIIGPGGDLPDGGSQNGDGSGGTTPPKPDGGDSDGGSGGNGQDRGKLTAMQQSADGEWQSWDVLSTLDLFYHREGTAENGSICPGSKGYYDFKISNTRRETLTFSISIEETKMHIPMKFRLRNMSQEKFLTLPWQGPFSTVSGTLMLKEDRIAAGTETSYRLEWEWPYDGGRDEEDTLAGEEAAKGEQYYLSMTVHAQAE